MHAARARSTRSSLSLAKARPPSRRAPPPGCTRRWAVRRRPRRRGGRPRSRGPTGPGPGGMLWPTLHAPVALPQSSQDPLDAAICSSQGRTASCCMLSVTETAGSPEPVVVPPLHDNAGAGAGGRSRALPGASVGLITWRSSYVGCQLLGERAPRSSGCSAKAGQECGQPGECAPSA